jgi:hypothetical protein
MSNGKFDLNEFIRESREVLVNPKSSFAGLKLQGGISEPLIKALVYGAIAGFFALLWSLLKIGSAETIMFGGAVGIMSLIWYIIASGIGLFIGAVILLVISSLCRGNSDFEANTRVTAATMVLMPVSAFFGFASGISHVLGLMITLIINLYGVWMVYNGLVESLKSSPSTAKIISYVLVAFFILTMIIGLGAHK